MRQNRQTIFEALGRHPIHPFPARMAPGIALAALAEAGRPLRVLDPMMGSGTVLAMAREYGHHASGVDMDPLAVLLARVWTTAADEREIIEKGQQVLDRARRLFPSLSHANAYPAGSTPETRKFIRYWFDEHARRQLAALASSISRVHSQKMRDALWCAFSRLIITKSVGASLAMDLSHSRPHKSFDRAPAKPFDVFASSVAMVAKNCVSSMKQNRGPKTSVTLGDARSLALPQNSIDLVLTSPPYLNAIDYIRCSKFSLVWMGYGVEQLRLTRKASIGSENAHLDAADDVGVQEVIKSLGLTPKLNTRNHGLLSRYVWDMRQALSEVARVLAKNGQAVYVVGDSTVRGTFVRNSEIVRSVAEQASLEFLSRRSRALPENRRYLPPPRKAGSSAAMDARMRREVVLTFKK